MHDEKKVNWQATSPIGTKATGTFEFEPRKFRFKIWKRHTQATSLTGTQKPSQPVLVFKI